MKKKKAGVCGQAPRNTTDASVNNTFDGEDKKVSVAAVKSVAFYYGISADIFRQWLEKERGFQITEQEA